MKKTLILTKEYYPFKGGVARYVYNLFKSFDRGKYLVVTDNSQVPSKENIINTRLSWPFIKPSWLFSFLKIKKIIKKNNIEQIFTPNILPLGTMAYYLKIPYIISLHGLDIRLALANKPKLSKKILANAKAIIVNSQSTKQEVDALELDNEAILVYPPLDFSCSCNQSKLDAFYKKFDIDKNVKVLLTVGRLTERKGQTQVIRAIKRLYKDFDFKYFIVGQGKDKAKLKEMINKYDLQDRVFIYSKVDDEDLPYFYHMADIFVMPHRQIGNDVEGFGMVFLEAAKCGLPIIAGNSGGINEVFEDQKSALFVDGQDLGQLIRAINSLLSDSDLADKLAKRGHQAAGDFIKKQDPTESLKSILS